MKKALRKVNDILVGMRGKLPPQSMPEELKSEYTMSGTIPVIDRYVNGVPFISLARIGSPKQIKKFMKMAQQRQGDHYPETDSWLYDALGKYSLEGKECVVMGSVSPFYESVCLVYGAKCVTTIEYGCCYYMDRRMKTITPQQYDQCGERFDVAFSISSFEHDGLGRYGDPLNPSGDLEAMRKMKKILKPGGILFLSVPVGPDCIYWNAHRMYGAKRLPLLLDGWEELDRFGYDDKYLSGKAKGHYQPVFVLKNNA